MTDGRIGIITGTARVVYKNQGSVVVSNAGTFPTGYFKSTPTVTFGGCRIDNNNASGEICNIFGVTKDKFDIWSRNINGHNITVTLLVDWIAIGERA